MTDYKESLRILSRQHFHLQTMLLDIRDIVRRQPAEDEAVARLEQIKELFDKDESGLV